MITVLDCGGRGGAHRSWKDLGIATRYISFEPDPEECLRLSQAGADDPWLIFESAPYALDRESGSMTLNLYDQRDLSSFFEVDTSATYRYAGAKLERTISVQAVSVDDFSAARDLTPDFLSIDAQGATLRILEGASRSLPKLLALRCEAEFSPLYRGAPLFSEVFSFLRMTGFRLRRIETPGAGIFGLSSEMNAFSIDGADGVPAACDAVFFNDHAVTAAVNGLGGAGGANRFAELLIYCLHQRCGYYGAELAAQARETQSGKAFLAGADEQIRQAVLGQYAIYFDYPRSNVNTGFDGRARFAQIFGEQIDQAGRWPVAATAKKLDALYRPALRA